MPASESTAARTGRPPLSERRRQQTRLEVANEAVRLFGTQGVAATSAEEIAQAVGMSVRTLWRYFASKEECVRPLLTVGMEAMAARLRAWQPGAPLIPAEPSDDWFDTDAGKLAGMREIVRLTRDEPALRAVWLQAHHDAEALFTRALAERGGHDPAAMEPRVQAAVINAALRVAVEDWAWQAPRAEESTERVVAGMQQVMRRALRIAAAGLPDS
ncbi:TetR/AcrR family transcriptional regulator [Streptomyces sp. NPDC091292]|uniref:TetR/AcrR family transcriptional regulator n=1 Tax=Streptomyces sp. NPDC091292 TaxID=3365991 RepID=UPI003806C37E